MSAQVIEVRSEATPPDAPIEGKVDTQSPDRPQWLPEKFKSPEDMAKAYSELEKKLGSPRQGSQQEQASEQPEQQENQPVDPKQQEQNQVVQNAWESKFSDFSNEYSQKGQLSDDSYKKLNEMGYPREVVEAYIEGQKALAEKSVGGLLSEIGGPQSFEEMRSWAASNVPENELNAYNSLLDGSAEQAAMAVKGMYARYQAAQGGGRQPKLLAGSQTQGSTAPFRSTAELTRAMSDPKYRSDHAYRKEVEQRLAVSNIL